MLVLSRRPGEKVMIGKDIVIQVVEIRGNKVRLGITAPQNMTILREEVLDRLDDNPSDILPGRIL